MRQRLTPLIALGAGLFAATAYAAIPDKKPEELRKEAEQIVVGRLVDVYQAPPKREKDAEVTPFVVEVKVTKVEKGSRFKVGDLAHVRYSNARWVGKGLPPVGWGDGNIFIDAKPGDTVRVFLARDPEGGYHPLIPNGFQAASAAKPK